MPAAAPRRYTVRSYLALVDDGVLHPRDPVELLGGLVVAEPPVHPPYASATCRAETALRVAIGQQAVLRARQPFIAGRSSLPEPEIAVVPGALADYDRGHPRRALLIVEVAEGTPQEHRLTRAPIYAAVGVPEYWLVNLGDDCVEVFRKPNAARRRYELVERVERGDDLVVLTLADASVAVDDLLPKHR